MPSIYSVTESNAQPTSQISGGVSPGGAFVALGIARAGTSNSGVNQSFAGTYGSLLLLPNGTFTYTLNNNDPDTNVLGAGMQGQDRFTVTYSLNGVMATTVLTIQVQGVDEANQIVTTPSAWISVSEDFVLSSLEQVRSTAPYGLMVYGDYGETLSITNNGVLIVDAVPYSSIGLGFWGQAAGNVVNNGLIDVIGHYNEAGGINLWSGTLTNNGVIRVVADRLADPNMGSFAGQARGVGGGRIVNNGTIEVHSTKGLSIGVTSGLLDNSGIIYVTGDASADWVYGVSTGATNAQINNSGTIQVVSTAGGQTVGVSFFPDNTNVHQYGTLTNSGTILASIAVRAIGGYSTGIHVTNSGRIEGDLLFDHNMNIVTNVAGGVWVGNLQLGYDTDVLLNRGTISGNVSLGGGNDLFEGQGGTVSGTVYAGDGRDLIYGGSADDRIDGGDGNDRIVGGGGADVLTGGAGADVYVFTALSDSIAAAQDTIIGFQTGVDKLDFGALTPSQVNISPSGGYSIVTATVAGGTITVRVDGTVTPTDLIVQPETNVTAGPNDDFVLPIANFNYLFGYDGNDLLHGGPGAEFLIGGPGVDTMYGGGGEDVYEVDSDGDRIIELAGGGIDEVRTFVDYSLQAFVENGSLMGTLSIGLLGNNLANRLVGNDGENVLRGGGGDDIIIGGLGFDALEGGPGADRFVYQSALDAVGPSGDRLVAFEHGSDIVDLTAVAPLSYEFVEMPDASWGMFPWVAFMSHWTKVNVTTASGNVMTLWLQGQATLADFNVNAPLSGTSINDTLIGSADANVITGNAGNDTLTGGAGADTFRDTSAGLNGDTITDFVRGDRIVLTDATLGLAVGLTMGLSGSQLTYGSTSVFLSNVRNPSIAFSAAPEGGVQIFFGGPPIIFSSAVVSDDSTWGTSPSQTRLAASREIPVQYTEQAFLFGAAQFPDPLILQTADSLFVVS